MAAFPDFQKLYQALNARNADGALRDLTDDIDWPGAGGQGRIFGQAALKHDWTQYWSVASDRLEPKGIGVLPDGRIVVDARQVVTAPDGAVRSERKVRHTFTLRDGKIARMDVD